MKVNYNLSTILDTISDPEMSEPGEELTFWMGVHPFSSVVLICSSTEERLTSWMGVHPFLSVVLICSSTGERLTPWMGDHPFLSVVLISSSTGEQLTYWMGVHPFLSVVLICLSTESDSHTGWVFTVLVSGSDLLKHWRETHSLDGCSPVQGRSCQWF